MLPLFPFLKLFDVQKYLWIKEIAEKKLGVRESVCFQPSKAAFTHLHSLWKRFFQPGGVAFTPSSSDSACWGANGGSGDTGNAWLFFFYGKFGPVFWVPFWTVSSEKNIRRASFDVKVLFFDAKWSRTGKFTPDEVFFEEGEMEKDVSFCWNLTIVAHQNVGSENPWTGLWTAIVRNYTATSFFS